MRRRLWESLHEKGRTIQGVAVAREDRALERAETVLRHWIRASSPKVNLGDPAAAREYAKSKRTVLTGDSTVINPCGGLTAALKRAIWCQTLVDTANRSVGGVINSYCRGSATRLPEADFDR